MGVARALMLLVTVVLGATVTAFENVRTEDDKHLNNEKRLITVCNQDKMEIHLSRDFEKMRLASDEPECQPKWGSFVGYDGKSTRVKTWTFPLIEGKDGPCGMRYLPVNGTEMWAHSVTVFGPLQGMERTVKCLRTGLLDKRGAHIRLETITPFLRNVTAPRGTVVRQDTVGGSVEFLRGTTLSATFHSRFPKEAGISLHPLRCWIVNERKKTRRMVVNNGCAVPVGKEGRTVVTLGSETGSGAAGDTTHIFFNADEGLFEHEDPTDLPLFHLQCDVMPCKGTPLFSQVIGVGRCPTISWCESNREMTYQPEDHFEINLPYAVAIADSSIEPEKYRELGMGVYPVVYWTADAYNREMLAAKREESGTNWLAIVLISLGVVGFALVAGAYFAICRWREGRRQRAKAARLSSVEARQDNAQLLMSRTGAGAGAGAGNNPIELIDSRMCWEEEEERRARESERRAEEAEAREMELCRRGDCYDKVKARLSEGKFPFSIEHHRRNGACLLISYDENKKVSMTDLPYFTKCTNID